MVRCKILGCGHYLPEQIVSNRDLEKTLDTTDEWIRTRTGIEQRYVATTDQYSSHLALKAAQHAIYDANLQTSDIDLIVVCTTTPDNSFPSTATKVQSYLGLNNVPSFDLQAVCSGFIYGLQVVDQLIKSGKYSTALLIGAEKMSSLLNWQDRQTCILFGDGAGAVILQRTEEDAGIIDTKLYSDGSYYNLLYTNGGVGMTRQSGTIEMQGPILFKHAVDKMTGAVTEILSINNLSIDTVNYIIPHQANIRIIQAVAERLNVDMSKVVTTIDKHANCSAASIPLALSALKTSGSIHKGALLALAAFGAGLTWGAALIKW